MRKDGFTVCANNYINCLRQEGRYATAHVYENALRSFTIFCGTECVSFSLITRENLKRDSSIAQFLAKIRLEINHATVTLFQIRPVLKLRGRDDKYIPLIIRRIDTSHRILTYHSYPMIIDGVTSIPHTRGH